MPSKGTTARSRGYIVPVGGAENKKGDRPILERFARIAGGSDARIVVIPTASELDDTGDRYADIFDDLQVESVEVLPVEERKDALTPSYAKVLEDATGIFLTGGNQLRLSTILGGTPIAQLLRRLNADGVHVGGTSAGAAIIPEHMIAGGPGGSTPRADGVILAPGLGLTNNVIIDQHFRQRDRIGRLLAAVSFNPFAIGIGLDEDTAAFINAGNVFEVVGTGATTVVDPTNLDYSSMDSARPGEPVSLIGLKLHVLAEGARYDLTNRIATPPEREPVEA